MKFSRKKGYTGSRILFNTYKSVARNKKLPFTLSFDKFVKITSSACIYCDVSPYKIMKGHLWCSPETRKHGAYKYNGIDRIDNTKGYVESNCVPCCIICNKAKREMTIQQFLSWVGIVYETRN
jgi:hypothetical protein